MLVHHRIPSMKWLGVLLLPPGWDASPSQDTQNEVTRSITTYPVWSELEYYYSPLDGMLVHHRIPSMKWLGVLLLPPGWDASPSQDTQNEVTRSITTYPVWSDLEYYYSSLDGMLVHHRIPSMKWLGVLLLLPGWDASPSQDTQHEVTRSITSPPLDGILVHHRIPRMKWLGVLLLTQYEVTWSITTSPWMGC